MRSAPIAPRSKALSTSANRRATVRYRCPKQKKGRAFHANSSNCVAATVMDVSRGGIGLVMAACVETGTLLRIEIDKVPFVDLVANVTHAELLDNGEWRYGCEWTHGLSDAELHALRHGQD